MSNDEDDKQFVLDQQSKRFAVLKFIWQETRIKPKDSLICSTVKDIAIETRINGDDLLGILQYLKSEGLIELSQYERQSVSRITHQGKVEMEEAITRPSQDTEHFLSSVIVTMNQTTINGDAIGNVISSSVNAPITTTISNSHRTEEFSEILKAIAELRQHINSLPNEFQDVAADALDTLESEITTPTKTAKLKVALFSLWGVAHGVATFANAVTAIADRFGVKFN